MIENMMQFAIASGAWFLVFVPAYAKWLDPVYEICIKYWRKFMNSESFALIALAAGLFILPILIIDRIDSNVIKYAVIGAVVGFALGLIVYADRHKT